MYNMVGHAGISIQGPSTAFIAECIALEPALDALVDVFFKLLVSLRAVVRNFGRAMASSLAEGRSDRGSR